MTTHNPSLGKSPVPQGVGLSPAPLAPPKTPRPPSGSPARPPLSLLTSLPSILVLLQRSLLFSKFPEFFCFCVLLCCVWVSLSLLLLLSLIFLSSLLFPFCCILSLFLSFPLSLSLGLSLSLSLLLPHPWVQRDCMKVVEMGRAYWPSGVAL